MAETGLLACRSEKTGTVSRCNANTKDFLWSGLTMKTSELAGISRDFRGTTSGFLCTSDCVAEGEGFEPSVRFCHGKPRHVRKLQIANPYQRISHQTRRQSFAITTFNSDSRQLRSLTRSAFLGTSPTDEPIISGLPVIQGAWERKF
jgi:hypothetical protein